MVDAEKANAKFNALVLARDTLVQKYAEEKDAKGTATYPRGDTIINLADKFWNFMNSY